MGLNLDKAREKVFVTKVKVGGDELTIEWYPQKTDAAWNKRVSEAKNDMDMVGLLAEVWRAWDAEADLERVYRAAYPDEDEFQEKTGGRELGYGPIPLEPELMYYSGLSVFAWDNILNKMREEYADPNKTAKKG